LFLSEIKIFTSSLKTWIVLPAQTPTLFIPFVISCSYTYSNGSSSILSPVNLKPKFSTNSLNILGESQKALEFINTALELDPNDIGALCNKGIILKDLNEVQEALDVFDKVLEMDPDFELAKEEKEEILGKP